MSSQDTVILLMEDLKDIWSKSGKVAACASLSLLGVNAVISGLLEPSSKIDEIIALTVPLACSATIIALLVMRGYFKEKKNFEPVLAIIAAIIVPFIIAELFGAVSLHEVEYFYAPSSDNALDNLPQIVGLGFGLGIFSYYFSSYGLARTLSSIICGCLIAWVLQKTLPPRTWEPTDEN
jgi:branched-subunit amino acid ABC-type transport system permease component